MVRLAKQDASGGVSGPIAVRQPPARYLVCHLSLLLPRPLPASISNIKNIWPYILFRISQNVTKIMDFEINSSDLV